MLLLAGHASALELRAYRNQPVDGCGYVVVNPAYTGEDRCVVAVIPSDATRLTWQATELWEMPPAGSQSGWTRLTCGATLAGQRWSFSCFNAGTLGEYQGVRMSGWYDGSAAQLDTTVRAWWQAQR